MCETLINEFDPLRNPRVSSQPPSRGPSVDIKRPRPISNRPRPSLDPQSLVHSKNPFLKPETIRASHSDTNISTLGLEVPPANAHIHSTTSHLTLTNKRMGFVETSPDHNIAPPIGSSPSLGGPPRPHGLSNPMSNPFLEEADHTHKVPVVDKFWLEEGDSDIETTRVDQEQEKKAGGGAGMGTRTASLDVLNERDTTTPSSPSSRETLDYTFRRMRTTTSSSPHFTQSCEYVAEAPPILKPTRSKTSTVQVSKAISKSPKLFRKKVCYNGWAGSVLFTLFIHCFIN